VEIGVDALRGEPNDGAPGAGPALAAAFCGGLAFAIAVVIDQDNQPRDPGNCGESAETPARDHGPSRLQGAAAIGDAGGCRQRGFEAFADYEMASGRPQLDRSDAAEGETINLAHPCFPQLEGDPLDSDRFISLRVAHERDQTRPKRPHTEGAAGEAQA